MNLTPDERLHLAIIKDTVNKLNRLTRVQYKELNYRVYTSDDKDPAKVYVEAYRPDNQLDRMMLGD